MTQLVALFSFLSYVVAAPPPLSLVNLAELNSIFPVFNISGSLNNVTRPADAVLRFPPGPQPPDPPGVIDYTVPRSNPKMILKFRDWDLNPERNESKTYDVFRVAFRAASDPALRDTVMPEEPHLWTSGGVEFGIIPKKGHEEQVPLLTWGLWHMALTGVDNFRRFYPKLNFVFEVYVYPPGYEEVDNYLGSGYLVS